MIIEELLASSHPEDAQYLEAGMALKVKIARRWIESHEKEIGIRLYEDVINDYLKIRPKDDRAFMFAWCENFGGI